MTDVMGEYVRRRLDRWGEVFALHRDCEYLGHQSRNMLAVLIEHRGEMPARATGYKPLEVDQLALQVETIVSRMAQDGLRAAACVMRAYYCGHGRRGVERLETANELLRACGERGVKLRQYRTLHDIGFAYVLGALAARGEAA